MLNLSRICGDPEIGETIDFETTKLDSDKDQLC